MCRRIRRNLAMNRRNRPRRRMDLRRIREIGEDSRCRQEMRPVSPLRRRNGRHRREMLRICPISRHIRRKLSHRRKMPRTCRGSRRLRLTRRHRREMSRGDRHLRRTDRQSRVVPPVSNRGGSRGSFYPSKWLPVFTRRCLNHPSDDAIIRMFPSGGDTPVVLL